MWIFTTKNSFVSVVQHRQHHDILIVRARRAEDLERFFRDKLNGKGHTQIIHDQKADYPYRVMVSRRLFAQAVAEHALTIDYDNFKAASARARGEDWHTVLLQIWSILKFWRY